MSSEISDLISLLKLKFKELWHSSITIQLQRRYKIKAGYIFLIAFFLLIFGFLLGLSSAKFELTKQILSAPVFASVFAVLIGIFGVNYIKAKEFSRINSTIKLESVSKILILKEPFSAKTIDFSKEIVTKFSTNTTLILINFLIRKASNQNDVRN